MAIVYLDNFTSALTAAVAANATTIKLAPADAAKLAAVLTWGVAIDQGTVEASKVLRLPLYIDSGSAVERVEAVFAASATGNVSVVRGGAVAWPTGTTVRCSPPAEAVAAGHKTASNVAGNSLFAMPGEVVNVAPAAGDVTIKLLTTDFWDQSVQVFKGEAWPAEVVIKMGGTARGVNFMDMYEMSPVQVYKPGVAFSAPNIAIPACQWARLRIVMLPAGAGLRSNGAVEFTVSMETFG